MASVDQIRTYPSVKHGLAAVLDTSESHEHYGATNLQRQLLGVSHLAKRDSCRLRNL